jgi:hypothetical protein
VTDPQSPVPAVPGSPTIDAEPPGEAGPSDPTGRGLPAADVKARPQAGAVPALPLGAVFDGAGTLAEAFQADLAALREQVEAALDRSIDRCARCKVCDTQVNAVMAAIGAEFDRMHAAMEHAESAAAGSHEGIRVWMLDCGELVAKHRERAEAAERKLAMITAARSVLLPALDAVIAGEPEGWRRDGHVRARDVLAIIGSEEEARDGC